MIVSLSPEAVKALADIVTSDLSPDMQEEINKAAHSALRPHVPSQAAINNAKRCDQDCLWAADFAEWAIAEFNLQRDPEGPA